MDSIALSRDLMETKEPRSILDDRNLGHAQDFTQVRAIRMKEVPSLCGDVVQVRRKEAEGASYDGVCVGWEEGLNAVMDGKIYTINNIREYEKEYKKNPDRAFKQQLFPYCSLAWLYILQSSDIKYPPLDRRFKMRGCERYPYLPDSPPPVIFT